MIDLVERHRPEPGQRDLRGFEWRYLRRLCAKKWRAPALDHSGAVMEMAFSPDGDVLATVDANGNIRFWDGRTGSLRMLFQKVLERVTGIRFSPDGKMFAGLVDGQSVKVWDVRTSKLLHDLAPDDASSSGPSPSVNSLVIFHDLAFGPSGQLAAASSPGGIIRNAPKHS